MAGTYYGDYLGLPQLLNSQNPKSKELGSEAHDEMLFIIVHQVYELWFRQILHELDAVLMSFREPVLAEKELSGMVHRLERVVEIQKLILGQLRVLETMTPMDFLEFRDLLVPASGFQSVQFREIEIKMGLLTHQRKNVDRQYFMGRLSKPDQDRLYEAEKQPNLLVLLDAWLARTPFMQKNEFDFWKEYRKSVTQMLDSDRAIIENNPLLSDKERANQVENLNSTVATFESLFDSGVYQQQIDQGARKLSQKAMLGALFISLYREEPILYLPFRLLTALIDIDEGFTNWRYQHALMVHRMLGTKIGTGGSGGHYYLKKAAEHNRVFIDLFDISTFLVPKSKLPHLPEGLAKELNFYHGSSNEL